MLAGQVPTMTILYGKFVDLINRFVPFNIDLVEVKLSEFGNHHSKISILKYKDNKIRIIISTANLYVIFSVYGYRLFYLCFSPQRMIVKVNQEQTSNETF